MIEPAGKVARAISSGGFVVRLTIVIATAFGLGEAAPHAWVFQSAPDFVSARLAEWASQNHKHELLVQRMR